MQILYFYDSIKPIKNIIIVLLLDIYLISINTWLQLDRHAMSARAI